MSTNTIRESINCNNYHQEKEFTHLQQLADNLPYFLMVFSGAIVFIIGLSTSLWGWILSGLYILYGITGALWIIIFICPYCNYYDTRACPCGYGQIAAKLKPKKNEKRFAEKFKKQIPVIVPLWVIPLIAGGIFLIQNFSLGLSTLLILFVINSFVVLPLVSRKYGCSHCPQKDTCPWMTGKQSKPSELPDQVLL